MQAKVRAIVIADGSSVGDNSKAMYCDKKESRKELSTPVRGVDLLEASQARVGLERHSKLCNPFITDRVVA
jgi:hypothetical protein